MRHGKSSECRILSRMRQFFKKSLTEKGNKERRMKHCVRCAGEIPDSASFCRFCGVRQVLDEGRQDFGADNFSGNDVFYKTIHELIRRSVSAHAQMIKVQENIISAIMELILSVSASSDSHDCFVNAAN